MSKKLTEQELAELEHDKQFLINKLKQANYNVYTSLYSVSSSGMSRKMSAYIALPEGQIMCIDWYIVRLGVAKWDRDKRHLTIGGCGMDMGFHLVYSLGRTLFPNGFVPAEHDKYGRNRSSREELDTDGGYALKQHWL